MSTESLDGDEDDDDTSSSIDSPRRVAMSRDDNISREERLKQLEEAVASGSDIEWDYDAIGMTYEELMEYFDNLKESTA